MKKPKNYDKVKTWDNYWVTIDGVVHSIRATSPEQAESWVKYNMGLADNYEWHEVETNSVEIAHTKIIDNREEIKC